MPAYTISNQNGPIAARGHNIRDPKSIQNQLHILPEGVHETWADEKPRDAYKRIFGDAVKKYNADQRRKGHPERVITNYYKDISEDKKKHAVYEVIITVGNRDERIDDATGKQIMKDYVDGWKERNPNLELIGAYYHADEYDPETGIFGTPHVHIDYVPIERYREKGLSEQNSLTGALGQMGFVSSGPGNTAIMKWQRSERAELERICHTHGIDVVEKKRDKRHHLDTETYKKVKEAERKVGILNEQANEISGEINSMLGQKDDIESEIDELMLDLEQTSDRLKKLKAAELTSEEINSIKATSSGDIIEVGVDAFASLKLTASEADDEKKKRRRAEEEKRLLEEDNKRLRQELEDVQNSLYTTAENFRQLGKYFQAYIDFVKDEDPEFADMATKAAIEASNADRMVIDSEDQYTDSEYTGDDDDMR